MDADKRGFERFARLLIDEIGASALLESDEAIHYHEDLVQEIRELRRLIANSGTDDAAILSAAFGIVDTYSDLRWAKLLDAARTEYMRAEQSR